MILDATVPANTESPSLGASRIRAIIQNLIDLFNLPSATNIAAALTITRLGPLTNQTGVTLSAGDVVALDLANNSSVALSDAQGSLRQFVVALATITAAATGVFGQSGQVTVTTQGAVTRGNYLRKSATTKALEDTGTAPSTTAVMPSGTVGVALTAAAGPGAGTVVALLFGVTAAPPVVVGSAEIRNLVGANNAGTPNTQFDYSADLVELRSSTDGSVVVRTNTGTLTNNTATAGPAANGRDQAGAFGASTWLHFYFIWNGTTLATLSSLTAPPTGPALPTGYTHWAYAGSIYYNATPLLVKTYWRGTWAYYEARQAALTGGTANAETTVSLTTLVPPNALAYKLAGVVGNTAGNSNLSIRVVLGVNYATMSCPNTTPRVGYFSDELPNIGQQFFYLFDVAPTGGADLDVRGYKMPNGGD